MTRSHRPHLHAAALAGALAVGACASEPADTTAAAATTIAATTTSAPTATATAATTDAPTATAATTDAEPDDTAADDTAAACGHGGIDDCCCFAVSGPADRPILGIGCVAGEAPCEAPQARCPGAQTHCDVAELEVTSAEGLDCVLGALAAGKPVQLSWGIAGGDGLTGSVHSVFVQGDGTAFLSTYAYDDVGYSYGAVERRTLQPPDFFDGCMSGSDAARFDCLARAAPGAATETCVDGFMGVLEP